MKKMAICSLMAAAILLAPDKSAGGDGIAQRGCGVSVEVEAEAEAAEAETDGETEEPSAEYGLEELVTDAEDTWIPEEYQEYCRKIGGKYNLCPELLMAMIERESGGKKDACNDDGDTGLMQVNPKWHYDRMERLGVTDLYDPYSNILVAADYLAELYGQEEDTYLVLMEYNMVHSAARELYDRGAYSAYAIEVTERSRELEILHERKGE